MLKIILAILFYGGLAVAIFASLFMQILILALLIEHILDDINK